MILDRINRIDRTEVFLTTDFMDVHGFFCHGDTESIEILSAFALCLNPC